MLQKTVALCFMEVKLEFWGFLKLATHLNLIQIYYVMHQIYHFLLLISSFNSYIINFMKIIFKLLILVLLYPTLIASQNAGEQPQFLLEPNTLEPIAKFSEDFPDNREKQQLNQPRYEQQNNILEQEERNQNQQILAQENARLHEWVYKEIVDFGQQSKIMTEQEFTFKLKSGAETMFKWTPNRKSTFRFAVNTYQLISSKDLIVSQNPDEDEYVLVSANTVNDGFSQIGKVYISRTFPLIFNQEYRLIKFKNFNDETMVIQVSLQETVSILSNGINDDLFAPKAEISQIMLKELRQSESKQEKIFNTEWSFKDREERHQSSLLYVTGIELVVILGTSAIQVVCIKRLFDNRIIV